jgi:hypothetical protein
MKAIKNSMKLAIVLAISMSTSFYTYAATYLTVGGTIADTVTWNVDSVSVTSNVTVTSTGLLTIPAKTKVVFQGQYSITVQGTISATGSITFTRIGRLIIRTYNYVLFTYKNDTNNLSNPSISTVGWKGITIQSGAKANFSICEFRYAKSLTGSLFVNSGNTNFSNCLIHDNKIFNSSLCGIISSSPSSTEDSLIIASSSLYNNYSAATVFASSKFSITLNKIYNNINTNAGHINDKSALSVNSGNGIIARNTIYNNSQAGINICWTSLITLDRNYIYNNKSYGIYFKYSVITLTNNIISNNVQAGYINGTIAAFINNTIAYNAAGLNFVKPSLAGGVDVYFYNTIMWNNNATDLSGNMNIYINNCLLPYSSSSAISGLGFSVKSFNKNINIDPQFKSPTDTMGYNFNASSASWSIGSNSPCLNIGTTAIDPYIMPQTDYAGSARIKHGYPDIGAYEMLVSVDSIYTATITTPTMWIADSVKIFTNVSVNPGGKLVIAPGTIVSFQGDYQLTVANNGGGIIAKGTATDSVVFTRQNPVLPISATTGVFWMGINIQSSVDSCLFDYCRFEFAERKGGWKGAALNVDFNDLVNIRNSLFRYNISRDAGSPTSLTGSGAAIATFNSDVSIDHCTFTDNLGGNTVYINSSNVMMSNCYFTRNMYDLTLYYSAKSIIYNTITRAADVISSSNPNIVNCEFYGNSSMSLSTSNPRFYNSVVFTSIVWNDQSTPAFTNCMFKSTNYSSLSEYSVNGYLPVVSYLPSFTWEEGNNNFGLRDYTRNSFYPSINRGTSSLPSGINIPVTDLIGYKRINGEAIDIGAIEQSGQLPQITLQPSGSTICPKTEYAFNVLNTDTAIYQWRKDGVDLTGANSKNYGIKTTTASSSGNYQCIIQNAYGTVASNLALLQVNSSPEVLSQLSSAWVPINSAYSLQAAFSGTKPITYEWRHNKSLILSDSIGILDFPSFNTNNEGNYICSAINNCGKASIKSIMLYIAPSIDFKDSAKSICEGDTVKLSLSSGNVINIQWFRNNDSIPSSNSNVLSLDAISKDDEGNYTCSVTTLLGTATTNQVYVSVNQKPEIISQPSSKWVEPGSSFTNEISVNGSKPLFYQWYCNDSIILGERNPRFILAGFENKNEGIYHAIARNSCGRDTTTRVAFYFTPKIKIATHDSLPVLCNGDTLKLALDITFSASVQWQKDGKDLVDENSSLLVIPGVSDNNQGNYVCKISTQYENYTTSPILIQVRTAPLILDQSSKSVVAENADQVLEIIADGYKPIKYQWLKDNSILTSDTLFRLKLKSFGLDDEGQYICRITNTCGSIYSEPVELSMAPQICMVTVDRMTHKNLVIWEKLSKAKYKEFNVYREGTVSGYFEKIGTVPYDSNGYFVDKVVNPKEQAYIYKITAIDSNQVETDINLCKAHKTIHLLVTKGIPDGIQLDWDEYIGYNYGTYEIYRSSDSIDFRSVHEMASTTRTWTDFSTPDQDLLHYFISVVKEGGCYPAGRPKTKAGGGLYSQSESNMEDNRLQFTSINKMGSTNVGLNIFPNPFANIATVSYQLSQPATVSLEIYNMVGVKVAALMYSRQIQGEHKYQLNVKSIGLKTGIYVISLKLDNRAIENKLLNIL